MASSSPVDGVEELPDSELDRPNPNPVPSLTSSEEDQGEATKTLNRGSEEQSAAEDQDKENAERSDVVSGGEDTACDENEFKGGDTSAAGRSDQAGAKRSDRDSPEADSGKTDSAGSVQCLQEVKSSIDSGEVKSGIDSGEDERRTSCERNTSEVLNLTKDDSVHATTRELVVTSSKKAVEPGDACPGQDQISAYQGREAKHQPAEVAGVVPSVAVAVVVQSSTSDEKDISEKVSEAASDEKAEPAQSGRLSLDSERQEQAETTESRSQQASPTTLDQQVCGSL